MPRLFAAIRPPAAVRDALIDLMDGVEGARWQDEDQLHLTLRFVGEIDNAAANDLAEALARIDAPRFELAIAGVGHFERKGRVHTLWAGLTASPALAALAAKIERACQAQGLEPEHRKFSPHVTLARLNQRSGPAAPWLAAHAGLRCDAWTVEAFRLYESTLRPGGSEYEPVVRYPLRK
ncbi:MAG: RNA 2',3'-cyclic phosphodiesterase [Tsuneonella sp.]